MIHVFKRHTAFITFLTFVALHIRVHRTGIGVYMIIATMVSGSGVCFRSSVVLFCLVACYGTAARSITGKMRILKSDFMIAE